MRQFEHRCLHAEGSIAVDAVAADVADNIEPAVVAADADDIAAAGVSLPIVENQHLPELADDSEDVVVDDDDVPAVVADADDTDELGALVVGVAAAVAVNMPVVFDAEALPDAGSEELHFDSALSADVVEPACHLPDVELVIAVLVEPNSEQPAANDCVQLESGAGAAPLDDGAVLAVALLRAMIATAEQLVDVPSAVMGSAVEPCGVHVPLVELKFVARELPVASFGVHQLK